MSKEKQIEERLELSDIIDYAIRDWDDYVEECHEEGNSPIDTFEECIADAVIGAGYRKQSEGEWKFNAPDKHGNKKPYCTNCGEYHLGHWSDYVRCKYCPNCGAKMKGGE